MIADKLQINRESVRQIVIQNLGMRKTCHAPHHKSDDQRQERLEASKDFVETAKVTPNFLNCIVTKDESLCLRYGLEMKRQTMEWRSLASPPRWKKVRGFLPERTAGDECCKVHWNFDPFHETSSRVRSQYAQGSWFFVHDNACPHTSNIVKPFQAKKKVVQIEHSPYSPDLNPPNFFLFPWLALKGEFWQYFWHPMKRDEVFEPKESHPKRRLLTKFPGHVYLTLATHTLESDYFEGQ